MRIQFIVPFLRPYDSRTVREQPCGGTERATIFLGEALARLGHEIRHACTDEQVAAVESDWPEAVISPWGHPFPRFPRARKVWWPHQFTDRPFVWQQAPLVRRYADDVVTLSVAHQSEFQRVLGMESVVIGHGVWHAEVHEVVAKEPAKLIYCSVPQRGLDLVPSLFRRIKAAEPEARITICSSLATWGRPDEDLHFAELFAQLRDLPGVTLLGGVNQARLYAELATAAVFFYPCTYRETYCMALDEAMAHGCVPVFTSCGALPERFPPSPRLVHSAVEAIRCARSRRAAVPVPPDWSTVAERWHHLLTG